MFEIAGTGWRNHDFHLLLSGVPSENVFQCSEINHIMDGIGFEYLPETSVIIIDIRG